MSHTPGPWKSVSSPHGKKYRCVQIGKDEAYTTLEILPADAKLISAAPDLLQALQIFTKCAIPVSTEISPTGYSWSTAYLDEALQTAKAAIAKATGDINV